MAAATAVAARCWRWSSDRRAALYVLAEAERPPLQITIPDDDWGRVMAWARTTDKASGWLADPLHAVYYGTSVRVAGERDVFVEAVKDAAHRHVRSRDRRPHRRAARGRCPTSRRLAPADARALGARSTGSTTWSPSSALDLPLAFESGSAPRLSPPSDDRSSRAAACATAT